MPGLTDSIALSSYYRTMGVMFWEYALQAEDNLVKGEEDIPTKLISIPFYFLASHAAELLLKSALLKRGYTEKDLKKFDYRHDLSKLLEALQDKGIIVTPATIRVIHGLATRHKDHSLRYGGSLYDGKKTYSPPTSLVNNTLEELLVITRRATQGR